MAFNPSGQDKYVRDHLQNTHIDVYKMEETEEEMEQRKEQIGRCSKEEWGLAKPRCSAL